MSKVDYDFLLNLQELERAATQRYFECREDGDRKQARYFKGVMKGISMCQNTYDFCIKLEAEIEAKAKARATVQDWVINMGGEIPLA